MSAVYIFSLHKEIVKCFSKLQSEACGIQQMDVFTLYSPHFIDRHLMKTTISIFMIFLDEQSLCTFNQKVSVVGVFSWR